MLQHPTIDMMTDINIWAVPLTAEQVTTWTSCRTDEVLQDRRLQDEVLQDRRLDWTTANWTLQGIETGTLVYT